eukprot:CAMPEP_0171354122 /NCGR_PEP_ID=MMETSP0878-20121228/44544_1 /TAXON_ID=67004 /ORGANISM="Thalassiosira weissflogii, Strain CCMP1336" /LENGTH=195 /DNA_ID=CAMNT_0011860085 /DNA_START=505 /DNA_END=1092 /DNA_ORIENTATION=-
MTIMIKKTATTTPQILPSFPLLLLTILLLLKSPPKIHALDPQDELQGMWGSLKSATRPLCTSLKNQYGDLSDQGKFGVGAAMGFGCSRMAAGTAVKAVKTVGAAYVAFEALEYAGLLEEARINIRNFKNKNLNEKNRKMLSRTRDNIFNTMDGVRRDIRTTLNPQKVQAFVAERMEKDRSGTTGFGAGAFFGFLL